MLRYLATTAAPIARPGLLLDRDGVLNRRMVGGYVLRPQDIELLPVAVDAARRAHRRGTPIVIVSNQGAIARGLASAGEVLAVNAALLVALAAEGVGVDGIYVCPHHPEAGDPSMRACSCRKPRPGMIFQAAVDLTLDLGRSVFVGDQPSDADAAAAAGIPPWRTLLVDDGTDPAAVSEAVERALT